MASRSNRSISRLTAIGLIVASCMLAGCGRKAGLDLPPGASAAQKNADGTEASSTAGQNTSGNLSNEVYRAPGSSSIAVAPRGEKKRIPLDAILD